MTKSISADQMIGRKFGRWTIISLDRIDKGGNRVWLCECTCGSRKTVWQTNLYSGMSVSCGCYAREMTSACNRTHGATADGVPEFRIWAKMRSRCNCTSDKSYDRYGGRGIYVCERWQNDFTAFFSDMGPRPSRKHSLDRIDNEGPYSPVNCRWATPKEQARNKRTSRIIRIGDVWGTLAEWCEVFGMVRGTLLERLQRGWNPLDAVLRPVDHRRGPRNRRPVGKLEVRMPRELEANTGAVLICPRLSGADEEDVPR